MTEKTTKKSMRSRSAVAASLIALTLLSGVVHGYLDGRWVTQSSRGEKGDLLSQVPETLGDWTLMDEQELDENAARLLRCYGSIVRVYQNEQTGITVNVAVMLGPRGPIAVHTPEVCYSSVGTKQVRPRRITTITTENKRHQLWSVEFSRDNEPDAVQAVYYGWSEGGEFVAANSPRFWLTDDLYKIQLAGPVTGSAIDPCQSFLDEFMPHLEKFIQ